MINQSTYTQKKHITREAGIPMESPLKCYKPVYGDIPPCSPEILIGMDSGISNTAFSYIELIRDEMTNALIDFKYGDTYYFKEELDAFSCCLYAFIHKLRESCIFYDIPIPKKFSYMNWNHKNIPHICIKKDYLLLNRIDNLF